MDRRGGDRGELALDQLAAVLGEAELGPEQRLRRRRAERDDRRRADEPDLRVEPRRARVDLALARRLVDPVLAALPELEVLDRVGDVEVAAVDPGRLEGAVELAAGGADERMPLAILAVAGHLADEHDPRLRRPLAEHGLGRALPQVA